MHPRLPIIATVLAFVPACSSDSNSTSSTVKTVTATATLEPRSDNTTLAGTATFVQENDGDTKLTLEITGAPPGVHGAHIHETGDCSAADAASAGGHWNPATHDHGAPSATSHLGDLGNLTIGADGKGTLTLTKAEWTVNDGTDGDVVGRAIVIHAAEDDLQTQPTGNSGGRIGCGEIDFTSEETITLN